MNIKGVKIRAIVDVKEGVSQTSGKPWRKGTVVIDYPHGAEYTEVILADAFNEALDEAEGFLNQLVDVTIWMTTHEYNGRLYQDVKFSSATLVVMP